jgi:hypothetical protein
MKCEQCGLEINTQKEWWTQICTKALVPGGSHQIKKNELIKLNKANYGKI